MNVKRNASASSRVCSRAQRVSSRWLSRQLAHGHAVLDDPTSTTEQRRAARARINRTVLQLRALQDVPVMRRALQTDCS